MAKEMSDGEKIAVVAIAGGAVALFLLWLLGQGASNDAANASGSPTISANTPQPATYSVPPITFPTLPAGNGAPPPSVIFNTTNNYPSATGSGGGSSPAGTEPGSCGCPPQGATAVGNAAAQAQALATLIASGLIPTGVVAPGAFGNVSVESPLAMSWRWLINQKAQIASSAIWGPFD